MREIKFRAWHEKARVMHPEWRKIDTEGGEYLLEQFTGLHDKNGKEIYEGDIVRGNTNGNGVLNLPVEWREYSCGFEPFSDSRGNCGCCGEGFDPRVFEVVGNIHESPELLTNQPKTNA